MTTCVRVSIATYSLQQNLDFLRVLINCGLFIRVCAQSGAVEELSRATFWNREFRVLALARRALDGPGPGH